MAKRPGEVSSTRAAELLEVHEDTMRRWCSRAVAGETGRRVPPKEVVRRDFGGRYFVRKSWIERALAGEAT